MTYRKNRMVYGKKDDAAKKGFARQMCKVVSVIRFKTGDAQAHTPQPKNCAVIIPKDLWSLTAPECYSLLSPRPAAFLIAAKSPPGKYALFQLSPASTFLFPYDSLWVSKSDSSPHI